MVTITTPDGNFETTLFAIAERIPERLVKNCEDEAASDGAVWKDMGYLYRRKLTLGAMETDAIKALGHILEVARENLPAAIRDNLLLCTDYAPICEVTVPMKTESFSHADAVLVRQAIQEIRADILDIGNYELTSRQKDGGGGFLLHAKI